MRAGRAWSVGYAQGLPAAALTSAPTSAPSGTTVRFRPDAEIFRAGSRLDRRALTGRLELLAFLAPALRLTWSFGADSTARRGLAGLVAQHLDHALGPIAHHRASTGSVEVEVAIGWQRLHSLGEGEPRITSIVNFAVADQHGTHVDGLRDAIASLWNGDATTGGVLLQHGLVAAVAVELTAPRYGGEEKRELQSPEARAAVASVASDALRAWAAANPDALAAVRAQAVGSPGADFKIISARDVIRRRPAMYLGADGPDGVLVLVLELVAHAIEQHRAGRCSSIEVEVEGDEVTVRDDGPGLPLDTEHGAWWLRSTVPGIGNPWPPDAPPELPRGYRLGLGAMIALGSEVSVATVCRGRALRVTYRDGEPIAPMSSEPTGAATGTTISLRPDPALFSDVRPPRDKLAARLRRLAQKVPGLRLTWSFEDAPA